MRIVLVSMSTGRHRDDAAAEQQAVSNARFAEFSGLMDVTGPNKQQYADMHGYSYVDASNLLDNSRPASWSKIPAVLSVIDQYDWVFWLDTDTLITNLTLPVEALVPPLELVGSVPDVILTMDSSGVNAGVWLIRGRGCSWCRSFLERWWGMDSFIRRGAHDTKSGDNDALKYMLAHMDSSELSAHVGLAPQCAFNSYLWRPSLRNTLRYLFNPRSMLTGLWQPGDFVMHAAGVQNKMAVLRGFLQRHGLLAPAPRAVEQQQQHLHWREHYTAEEGADSDGATVAAADAGDPDRGNVGAMTAGALGRELLRMLPHSHRTVSGGKGHQGAAGEGRLLGGGEGAQGPAADSSGHQVVARHAGPSERWW